MNETKKNLQTKLFLAVNSATVLVSLYEIFYYALSSKYNFFNIVWHLLKEAFFARSPTFNPVTFVLITLPFGFYLLSLIFYFLIASILLALSRRITISRKVILLSFIVLLGAIGSFPIIFRIFLELYLMGVRGFLMDVVR